MVNATHSEIQQAETQDYARYDRIWQRVAPAMNPYPEVRASAAAVPAMAEQPRVTPPAAQGSTQNTEAAKAELSLPGAQADPCCLGSDAAELSAVLEAFAQEETADASTYRQLARYAPSRTAAAALREMGNAAQQRSRELWAALYLITGEQKMSGAAAVILPRLPYRELLRDRYHASACNGLNYSRAADATADPCLRRLLQRFAGENYAAADRLLRLTAQVQ